MLTGSNPSSTDLNVQYNPFQASEGTGSGILSPDQVIMSLIQRRLNLENGGVNCIPLPFERFRQEIPGIEQGQYVICTASTKVGKTQLTSFIYMYNTLEYAFQNPDKCSVHIIYFALEESPQRVIERYMSHLLWKLDGLRIAPADLRSTSTDYPVPQEAIDLLKTKPYQDRLHFFEKCVQFETEDTNVTGIRNVCVNYAKKVGKVNTHKIRSNADPTREVEVFDSYTPNDPNHYKIVIVDHLSLVDTERGYRLKDSMDKLSEYFVKYLRNRFGFTCVAVQQQAFDSEGLEAIKMKKLLPTAASLSDTKYTARDADLVIGLFSPDKFGIPTWNGYDITRLGSYARFMQVIANRNGEVGGVCPLFFDGAVCDFKELPLTSQVNELSQYYLEAESRKTYKQQRKLLSLGAVIATVIDNMKSNNNYNSK